MKEKDRRVRVREGDVTTGKMWESWDKRTQLSIAGFEDGR